MAHARPSTPAPASINFCTRPVLQLNHSHFPAGITRHISRPAVGPDQHFLRCLGKVDRAGDRHRFQVDHGHLIVPVQCDEQPAAVRRRRGTRSRYRASVSTLLTALVAVLMTASRGWVWSEVNTQRSSTAREIRCVLGEIGMTVTTWRDSRSRTTPSPGRRWRYNRAVRPG